MISNDADDSIVSGDYIDFAGERYYVIRNVDKMDPFFVSVISNVDHWLFVSSTGGLTAGRVSPDTSLFPYITVDRIHDSGIHTGSKTILRVTTNGKQHDWLPFNREHDDRFALTRNLYKSILGNKLCFEEVNHDLQIAFRYTWATSDAYGFSRNCELQNLSDDSVDVELLDGLQNILPAGTPRFAQTNTSNLVDAYKWAELDEDTGLAYFALYSGISDRAEPCESLKANVVYCLGLDTPKILISSEQVDRFRWGGVLQQEVHKRGIRGAYFVNETIELGPQASRQWQIVANIEHGQAEVVDLRQQLANPDAVAAAISESVSHGTDALARIMASGDGYQATAEENVTVHHYANVLFNILRGGVFDDQYTVTSRDLATTIWKFNHGVYERNRKLLAELPARLDLQTLLSIVREQGDLQLERLCNEYLPITFGRRHGDPSRPWNQFAIKLTQKYGDRLLSYEGNWRDIFQNWEALAFSFPEFIESIIAKFVNASTIDGYNPYRITKEGIDWEVEEKDNPWSFIGYWGDHQIIYLQKLLELSNDFHPARLSELLRRPVFCYANVPYRINPFDALLEDPKSTVMFDERVAEKIEAFVAEMGADGKLVLDADGDVYQVNLLEKLLVPLLAKLSNLVIDGGIWMNTQRPEWNDANNALVGQGLSMVTLYYTRRYVRFLQQLLADESESIAVSSEVNRWLTETCVALSKVRPLLGGEPISAGQRYESLVELGESASRHRQAIYQQETFSGTVDQTIDEIRAMLDDALAAIDHSIATNRQEDGLYHAYNTLNLQKESLEIDTLYPMLEGQVAVLSAGAIAPEEAVSVLEALFESDVYRPDQKSFMLYPDRQLPGFLAKNQVPSDQVKAIPLLQRMLNDGDKHIVVLDREGSYRFNSEFRNVGDLNAELGRLTEVYGDEIEAAREPLQALYEQVFNHKAFTGRSGTMFSFEGLGSIYWHMVGKLMLAVEENFFAALEQGTDKATCHRLGHLYYRIREGIGFNKTPAEYGAFPTDPYSHSPNHSGARQPGMTGQVKEEILCRFGELGARVHNGMVHFKPALLRAREFMTESRETGYVDVDGNWQTIVVPARGLAFTWCQVPIIYQLDDAAEPSLVITRKGGEQETLNQLSLPADESSEMFRRSGRIRHLAITLRTDMLFAE